MTIKIEETLLSVTYCGDSLYPDNEYGSDVPVKVTINNEVEPVNMEKTMVVHIGDVQLLPSDIDYIKQMINQAEKIISTF